MKPQLSLCVCLLLCTLGSAQAEKSTISIFVPDTDENYTSFYYQKRGIHAEIINNEILIALQKALPCSQSISMSELRAMMKWDKDRVLLTANPDGSMLEEMLGSAMGADYVLSSMFGNVGDEHHWLLSVTLIGLRPHWATVKAAATGEGRSEDVYMQMIQRVVDQIAAASICPWKGTITVTSTFVKDTTITSVEPGDGFSTKRTETLRDKKNEVWSIEVVGKASGKSFGKGSVRQETEFLKQSESESTGKLTCWRNTAPCSIVDDRMPSSFEHYLGYRKHKTQGSRNFDLMKIFVTYTSDTAMISVEGEPFRVGEGSGEEYEMVENTCGKCVSKDEKSDAWGAAWGAWIVSGPAKARSHKISGITKITGENGEVTEIRWDLHR